MMTAGKEIEAHIIRLAQKSRAVGIHLILATQKPTVDVIAGLMKSNPPARIAFQVASRTDSRVVLDEMRAERLLGNGDMLFLSPGTAPLPPDPAPGKLRIQPHAGDPPPPVVAFENDEDDWEEDALADEFEDDA